MNTENVGRALVALCNEDKGHEVVEKFYHDDIVSVEPSEEGGGTVEGMEALRAKHQWWFDNHEVHSEVAEGPYMGRDENEFFVKFAIDVTPTGSERVLLEELALYTVANGKIVKEAFLQIP